MLSDAQYALALNALPVLRQAEAAVVRAFKQEAFLARIPAGKTIFLEGDAVSAIALLISGAVRVYKVGETGREITLYRFGSGESCILTANAILSRMAFSAIATVEQEAEAVMIPAATFRQWMQQYDLWRDFVFSLLSQRLALVMEVVDEVTFRRMDIRVASFLLRQQDQNPIMITHQEIAAELGSSREVISRILEHLASQGMIAVERGAIRILNREQLETHAAL